MLFRQVLILCFSSLLLAGCGVPGPLTLPPDSNDSYLSRIQKQLNDLTGTNAVAAAEPDANAPVTVATPVEEAEFKSLADTDEEDYDAEESVGTEAIDVVPMELHTGPDLSGSME